MATNPGGTMTLPYKVKTNIIPGMKAGGALSPNVLAQLPDYTQTQYQYGGRGPIMPRKIVTPPADQPIYAQGQPGSMDGKPGTIVVADANHLPPGMTMGPTGAAYWQGTPGADGASGTTVIADKNHLPPGWTWGPTGAVPPPNPADPKSGAKPVDPTSAFAGIKPGHANEDAVNKIMAQYHIDPAKRAQVAAALAYNSAISQLQRNTAETMAQRGQDLKDINQWYGQAVDTQKNVQAADLKQGKASVARSVLGTKAVLGAIGGGANGAAGMVGEAGQIGTGQLQRDVVAGSQYDQRQLGVMQAGKAEALRSTAAADAKQVWDLQQQLADKQSEKGLYQSDQLSQNQDKAAQFALSGLSAKQQAQAADASAYQRALDEKNAPIKAAADRSTYQGIVAGGPSPKDKRSFINGLPGQVVGQDANGNWMAKTDPMTAYHALVQQARAQGYDPNDPEIKSAIMHSVQGLSSVYGNAHPYKKYTWDSQGRLHYKQLTPPKK